MNAFWETTRVLTAEDVDVNSRWRASSIFLAMQEAASAQCEPYGLGLADMRAQGLAWVLARARLSMACLPQLGQAVTLRTWPKPAQHLFFPRYYRFSVDGREVGTASFLYVQLDIATRRMAKPWLGGNEQLTCDSEPALPTPGNIPVLAAPAQTLTRAARYSDLDVNGHVNNTRYLDWFCDCFGSAHHAAWRLSEVLIHYNREIRAEETATLALQQQEGQSVLRGTVEGAPCFAVGATWARVQG